MQKVGSAGIKKDELEGLIIARSNRVHPVEVRKKSTLWKKYRRVMLDDSLIEGVVVCRACLKILTLTSARNSWNNLARHKDSCKGIKIE